MISVYLKSKLHLARVTGAELDYEGSLAIDRDLMDAVDLRPFEKILVSNRENGQRFETYVIEAPRGSGTICLNGAAAHLGSPGDRIVIFAFCYLTEDELRVHAPRIAILDGDNNIVGEGNV